MRYLTEDVYEKTYRLLCEAHFLKRIEPEEVDPMYQKWLAQKQQHESERAHISTEPTFKAVFIDNKNGKRRESILSQEEFDKYSDGDLYQLLGKKKNMVHNSEYSKIKDPVKLSRYNDDKNVRVFDRGTDTMSDPDLSGVKVTERYINYMKPKSNFGVQLTKTQASVEPFPEFDVWKSQQKEQEKIDSFRNGDRQITLS